MIIRLTLAMTSILVVAMLAACSESPRPSPEPATVQVAPAATATSTPAPTPSPTPVVPFEDSLSSADLASFQALPVEVQEALTDESLESGNDNALRYLRDMPDDPVPLSAILEPETQTILDSLDEPYRRQLLLEGYPDAGLRHLKKQWLGGELTDLEYYYGAFDPMVRDVHKIVIEDGHLLPPLDETLSPAAFKRFESLDPLLQVSFRQTWETTRADDSTSTTVFELERKLLDTPLEIPGIRDIGLPVEMASVLEREPELWAYVQRMVAAILVRDQAWGSDDAAPLQRLIEAYEAPGGREALKRGLIPGGRDPWLAMVCEPPEWGLVPPEYAIPRSFRDVHPARLVFAWPTPEDALSEAALANYKLLDQTMRDALEYWWYAQGPSPHDARFRSCLIARWDRGMADTPFTSMPGPEVFLPEDKRKFYDELTDHEKWATELNLAGDILDGEILFKRSRFGQTEHVSTFDSTPEEFLEGLRFSAVEWLCGFHSPACR